MNNSRSIWIKRLLLSFLVALLLLPALQAQFSFVSVPALGGYTEHPPRPEPSWSELWANSYQPALEKYLEDQLGFRGWFVRLRNQLAYSLFRTTHADDILVGQDQILFGEANIKAYLGEDFVGEAEVKRHVRKFKSVQDTLARRGIYLLYAFAPSKAFYYREMLPDHYRNRPRKRSNYTAYTDAMRAAGVNFLDYNGAFREWKDTAAYPLFPRGGIHWSGYGMRRGGTMLLDTLERRLGIDLPDYQLQGRPLSNEPLDTDNDMTKALNLFRDPPAYPMVYPDFAMLPPKPGQQKPNVLIIGDSFVWNIYNPFITGAFSAESKFWYYGVPEPNDPGLDYRQQYLSRDIILILFTEHNLKIFDAGFSDRAFGLFNPYTPRDQARIKALQQEIMQQPGAKDRLWEKAYQNNQTPEDAAYWEAAEQYEKLR